MSEVLDAASKKEWDKLLKVRRPLEVVWKFEHSASRAVWLYTLLRSVASASSLKRSPAPRRIHYSRRRASPMFHFLVGLHAEIAA